MVAGSLLFFAACARSADRDAPAPPIVTGEDASPPAVAAPDTRMVLTEAGRARVPRGQVAPIDPRASAFASLRQQSLPVYPADFVIGRLAAFDGPARRAREVAHDVLYAIIADNSGTAGDAASHPSVSFRSPGASTVADDLRTSVALIAADRQPDRGGIDVRIGTPRRLAGGEFSVPFRILEHSGGYAGELIVGAADGEWYTSDIQVADDRTMSAPYRPGADHGGL
ncbi:MAG: hypothetical protein EA382_03810 [Spirochaetaceae bacterium]|nr:MAG: hypothetical protein EA382_03810 [Spirochaetaceae bacterium]